MGTYKLSNGDRITQKELDRKIRLAKKQKLSDWVISKGYPYCSVCERNDCQPIDMAHTISVKECKESGRSELAFDPRNIWPVGRKCHQKQDGLALQWSGGKKS